MLHSGQFVVKCPQLLERPVRPHLDRAHLATLQAGDLVVLHPLKAVKHQHFALGGRQAQQCLPQEADLLPPFGRNARSRRNLPIVRDRDFPPPFAPLVVVRVPGDSVHPGSKRRSRLVGVPIAKNPPKDFLNQVLGTGPVTRHPDIETVQGGMMTVEENGQFPRVSRANSLHHGFIRPVAHGAFTWYLLRPGEKVTGVGRKAGIEAVRLSTPV